MTTNVAPLTLVAHSFGFDPTESRHHFLVQVPRGSLQKVQASEHFTWDEKAGSSSVTLGPHLEGQVRVILARSKWEAIADEVRAEFNRRLKQMGRKSGSWRVGPNLVSRELGKELVVLLWGIEDADPSLISNAVTNWKGLVPEERWWLYTQTAAATGHAVNGRGKGWRKAVRFALTENPVTGHSASETIVPEFFRLAAEKGQQESLFDTQSSARKEPNEH